MFNYMNVGFVQNRSYDEKIHAKELGYGMRDCVMTNDDFVYDEANHRVGWGRAIMGGTPVRLGSTGEYFDLPVGYSGPVTLKRVLNGTMSTVEMITAAPGVNDDTTYYFKLYDITTGVVSQDYRSIDWVHSFYLKNMGGSNIAWVLNGFTSETFDASALAGNRTLLNDKDIGYDDTIHDNTLLKDILKDIFDKTRTLIGTDKPFILNFDAGIGNVYNPNLGEALKELILNKYGYTIVDVLFNFKWTAGTGAGFTRDTYSNLNKIELWSASSGFYFEFEWDYNGFDDVIVRDRNGAPHADLWADIRYFTNDDDGWSIDCPYRDYISGMTFWVADYDDVSGKYTNADANIRYVPRVKSVAKPPNLSSGFADLIFDASHSMLGSLQSAPNPIAITQIAQTYFMFNYADETMPHPNGIVGRGLLTGFNNDMILAAIVIHYGDKDWSRPENLLQFAPVENWEPTLLKIETPNIVPEIDNGVRGDK